MATRQQILARAVLAAAMGGAYAAVAIVPGALADPNTTTPAITSPTTMTPTSSGPPTTRLSPNPSTSAPLP